MTMKVSLRWFYWALVTAGGVIVVGNHLKAGDFSDANWVGLNPGLPGANGFIYASVVDDEGNLYIGGRFTAVGTVKANNVSKWNGKSWSALGSGISSGSYTPAVVNALAVSGTNLYVGGCFGAAGGASATNIAKWDGSTWSALGSGIIGIVAWGWSLGVNALAIRGGDVYAGGSFWSAGGVLATNIAKWDGNAWSALGAGLNAGYNSSVWALDVTETNLFVGGQFTSAGGVATMNIAQWNGSAWSSLGGGWKGRSGR